jgi:hypothetical protein
MANGAVVQVAIFSALAVILMSIVILYTRRRAEHEPSQTVVPVRVVVEKQEVEIPADEKEEAKEPGPIDVAVTLKPVEREVEVPQAITIEATTTTAAVSNSVNLSTTAVAAKPPVVIDAQSLAKPEDRNQRILAGISENIRKSMIKPVPTYSPVEFPEKPRETEYVRVKKQIITPHGQIRFSILKDSISSNMLAVFRRASMEWKSPDDLIGFVPSYLEPEAEILNNQVLLVSTPGHNEKLAIPIRSVDAESSLSECFDFVSDVRSATNTPAVIVESDQQFEVVSRGVITQMAFMNRSERSHTGEIKLLGPKTQETVQSN